MQAFNFAKGYINMENFEQRWLDTQNMLRERFGKTPDMEGILFLVGFNELGSPDEKFSKEQKQDLMHIGVCTLLSLAGYYEPLGKDVDGWPHFHELERPSLTGAKEQEQLLKECAVIYFEG
jgi:hypothetical protein